MRTFDFVYRIILSDTQVHYTLIVSGLGNTNSVNSQTTLTAACLLRARQQVDQTAAVIAQWISPWTLK